MALCCKGCGQPVGSTWTTALGASWHPEHFVCGGCGLPVGQSFVPERGQPWHPACHQGAFTGCLSCSRGVLQSAAPSASGLPFCEECATTEVSRSKAENLFAVVHRWAEARGLDVRPRPPMRLVRRPGSLLRSNRSGPLLSS